MGFKADNPAGLDVEAFVDGNLPNEDATAVEAELKASPSALESMFAIARLNAALRKARAAALKDPALSSELKKVHRRHS